MCSTTPTCSRKDKRWQKLFGPPSLEYSESFRARPYSKRFVRHLEGYYAQSHPEEDFAETFAIWLTPDLDWRQQYRDWKALEKLEYVDKLDAASSPANRRWCFPNRKSAMPSRLRSRLDAHYRRRRRTYAQEFPDFFDGDLRKLFVDSDGAPDSERAATFLRRVEQIDSQCRLRLDRRAQVHHQPIAARPHRTLQPSSICA